MLGHGTGVANMATQPSETLVLKRCRARGIESRLPHLIRERPGEQPWPDAARDTQLLRILTVISQISDTERPSIQGHAAVQLLGISSKPNFSHTVALSGFSQEAPATLATDIVVVRVACDHIEPSGKAGVVPQPANILQRPQTRFLGQVCRISSRSAQIAFGV
jgi:hypothetical protein